MEGADASPPLFLFMRWVIAFAAPVILWAQDCASHVNAAQDFYLRKQYPQASGSFELALAACPQRAAILLELAKSRFMAQEFELAAGRLEELLKLQPRNAAALKLRGDVLYLLGQDKPAETSLLAAIKEEPRNPEPRYALGRIYYQQARFEESIEQLRKVLEADPNSYRAYDNLGLAYEGLNDTKRAIEYYGKALALVHKNHPEYDWVYGNMSNLMYKLGDYKQAFQFGAEAASRNPNSARNFFLTGKALAKLERWELAAKWLGQSVDLDANYSEARYQYAQALRKLGRKEEADKQLAAFRAITEKAPRNRR